MDYKKKIIDGLVFHPLLTSLLVVDFVMLLFLARLPFFFSLIMLGGLVALAMFFGQKMALFKN
jgi:hypothetical protein